MITIFTDIFKTHQVSLRLGREHIIIYDEFSSLGQDYNCFSEDLNQISTTKNYSNINLAHVEMREIFIVFEYHMHGARINSNKYLHNWTTYFENYPYLQIKKNIQNK